MLRRVSRVLFAVACAVAAGGGLLPLPVRAADEPAPRPAYTVGHLWPLAGATYELLRIEKDVYVFAAPGGEIRLTKNLALASVRRGDDFLEVAAPASIVWPLRSEAWGTAVSAWRASRPAGNVFARNRFRLAGERLIWRVDGSDEFELATGTVRAVKILYQMVASGLAAPDAVEWEIAMWYAPELGVFVKGVDRAFGLVTFELDRSIDVATLRRRAGLPELPALLPALDYRVRHRDAAKDLTCGLHCPPPAASELR